MKYTKEFNVWAFPFWSGAKGTITDIARAHKMDALQSLIIETFAYDEEPPTDTAINDFVWFERDFIYKNLGLDENGNLPDGEQETEE